jgi:hypothetical protein
VIVESGFRRDDRQRRILEAWRDAVHAGRYAGIGYDCANASVAQRIRRLGDKVWLRSPKLVAAAQLTGDQIVDLVTADPAPAVTTDPQPRPPDAATATRLQSRDATAAARPPKPVPAPVGTSRDPVPEPESPEAAAERERRYREAMGIPEPKPRRRWRR